MCIYSIITDCHNSVIYYSACTYLFIVQSSRRVNGEKKSRHVANEQGIEGSTSHHADDGQPHLSGVLRWPATKSDTQHVRYCLEKSPGVFLSY